MHTGRDFAVRLRYGGSFPNCSGRADCGGFGVGEHRRGPVCCPAASKAMGKPRAASGPMHAAGRPSTRGDTSRMEWPQQNQQSTGDACETDSGNGCRRCVLGESNAMDDGGFWFPTMPHISRGDCGRGRRRGALFVSSLLHKSRTNHSCSEQQAVRAAPRRAQSTRSTAANKACRMGLENKASRIGKENPSCKLVEVPQIAEGRHISTLSTKKPPDSFARAGGF